MPYHSFFRLHGFKHGRKPGFNRHYKSRLIMHGSKFAAARNKVRSFFHKRVSHSRPTFSKYPYNRNKFHSINRFRAGYGRHSYY